MAPEVGVALDLTNPEPEVDITAPAQRAEQQALNLVVSTATTGPARIDPRTTPGLEPA